MTQAWLSRLEEYLWPKGYRRDVWMIVDGARDQRIFGMLLESYLEYSCLYSGALPAALETAAPYLVQLEYENPRSRRLIEHAWGNNWGVFLKCDTRQDRVRRHLRGFLVVRDPSGNRLLFRYYDPRVLRLYIPTCSAEQLRSVFGPIERLMMEDGRPDTLLDFGFDGSKLFSTEFSFGLNAKAPANRQTRESQETGQSRPGMLAIRKDQVSMFSQVEIQKFEDWMVIHLRKFFPRQCSAMGESNLRETIQYGIKRAASYGVTAKRDVCKYIDVMIALDKNFDADERFPWATRLLAGRSTPGEKARALIEAAKVQVRHF